MNKIPINIDISRLEADLQKSASTTPDTNIGGVEIQNPSYGEIETLDNGYKLDYLSFTISDEYSFVSLLNELGYNLDDFDTINGRYLYNSGYTLNYYVNIFYNSPDKPIFKNSSSTVNFAFTGTGCTDLAIKHNNDIYKLFELLYSYEANITRIDLAYDDFHGLLDFKKIEEKLRASEYRSSKRSYNIVKSTNEDDNIGLEDLEIPYSMVETANVNKEQLSFCLYVGNARSTNKHNSFLKMYNKRLEFLGKNQILPPIAQRTKIWQRYELTFKKSKAHKIFSYFLFDQKYKKNIDRLYKESLREMIEFLEPTTTKEGEIQAKSRWEVSPWWDDFLEFDERLTFTGHERDADLGRTLKWVSKAVLPNLKMLELIFEKFGYNLYEVLENTKFYGGFTKKQERIIDSVEFISDDKFNEYLTQYFGGNKDENLPKE